MSKSPLVRIFKANVVMFGEEHFHKGCLAHLARPGYGDDRKLFRKSGKLFCYCTFQYNGIVGQIPRPAKLKITVSISNYSDPNESEV